MILASNWASFMNIIAVVCSYFYTTSGNSGIKREIFEYVVVLATGLTVFKSMSPIIANIYYL